MGYAWIAPSISFTMQLSVKSPIISLVKFQLNSISLRVMVHRGSNFAEGAAYINQALYLF